MRTMVSRSRIWGTKSKALSGLEGWLAAGGFEMKTKSVRASNHFKYSRDRVPDFRSCEASDAGAEWCANKRKRAD